MSKKTNKQQFETAYADAVIDDSGMNDVEFKEAHEVAENIRQLQWKGERMPLAEAAALYALIVGGYNEFEPDMFVKLLEAYPDAGIEATPMRAFSVGAFLHIPSNRIKVRAFIVEHLKPKECVFVAEGALRVWWD